MNKEEVKKVQNKLDEYYKLDKELTRLSDMNSLIADVNMKYNNIGDIRYVISITHGNGSNSKETTINFNDEDFKEIRQILSTRFQKICDKIENFKIEEGV